MGDEQEPQVPVDPRSPVRFIPPDRPAEAPEQGIALCLSGGGYRAMLFHAGALWRLHETGVLPTIKRISSVSGGSITAGALALAWPKLAGTTDRAPFESNVVKPVRTLASHTIDIASAVIGLLPGMSVSNRIAAAYDKHVFKGKTLQNLPDNPRFIINATSVQTGTLWRFSKPYMANYRVGMIKAPDLALSAAVTASSAFPPFLSPMQLPLDPARVEPVDGADLHREPYVSNAVLSDGGVYDNLGLETAWKNYDTILVSDGGGHFAPEEDPARDWGRHAYRVLNLIDSQVRALRQRQVIESYKARETDRNHRKGTYWGIRSAIAKYEVDGALPCPPQRTILLADEPTRLAAMDEALQERLINWGYAICDAAMRRHVIDPGTQPPPKFPYNRGV
ncbi:patatin-like phospholipase family protein [Pseudolabrys sp. FHR47]|uniref:patatin-like phospholipase family protein n=1 Tax=Pseudolabrys sp. FHR47 TaxID=2562284 RepID=UPI0010BF10B3|nr:patatin-like phospholipase family protein [Pseudolabrys sp. FHR47]